MYFIKEDATLFNVFCYRKKASDGKIKKVWKTPFDKNSLFILYRKNL